MKRVLYLLTILSTSCILATSCKKENEVKTVIPREIAFEELPFQEHASKDELFFKDNKTVTLYSTTDSLTALTKTIDNIGSQRIFFLEDAGDFFKINYLLYGDKPLSIASFVKKGDLVFKDQNSLEFVDLNKIRYSQTNGVYDDKTKTFEKWGNVKLITKEIYLQNKEVGNSKYIFAAKDILINKDLGIYQFTTNNGEEIEIPIDASTKEEGLLITNSIEGFSPILQSYIFKTTEEGESMYSFYSKRNKEADIQYEKTLPIYNKSTQIFAQLYNDGDVGSLFVIKTLNDNLQFNEKLLVNFVSFYTIPNSIYWVNDKTIFAKVIHTNNNDTDKYEYISIQLN